MINPIKQDISFKASNPNLYSKVANSQYQSAPSFKPQEAKEKKTFGERIHDTKIGFLNFLKGFNNVKDTTTGFLRGAVDGAMGALVVGVFGKNLKEHNGDFFKTIGGVIADTAGEAWKIVKNIPSIITTRSPLNTVLTAVKEPFKLAKKLKGNPATIAIATAVAVGLITFRTVQGKIIANRKNANLDHSVNEGHIPTK